CPWNRSTCCRAAHNGRLDILQWPRTEGCPWDHHTYEEPRRLGHGDVMNLASLNGCPLQVE
ncbi:unnamed protein product, partial [Laminaria digitata]